MKTHIFRIGALCLYLGLYVWFTSAAVGFIYEKYVFSVVENAAYDYQYVYNCDLDAVTYKDVIYEISGKVEDAIMALTILVVLLFYTAWYFIIDTYKHDIKVIYRRIADFISNLLQQSRG